MPTMKPLPLIAALVALGLAGCSKEAPAPTPAPAPKAQPAVPMPPAAPAAPPASAGQDAGNAAADAGKKK
jgi:hypothetical protein